MFIQYYLWKTILREKPPKNSATNHITIKIGTSLVAIGQFSVILKSICSFYLSKWS